MCHRKKTANKSYYLQEKTKNACETSSNLREIMRVNTSSPQYDDNDRISNTFKDCLESKKITMTIIWERRPILIDRDHLTDIQIRDKIRYIMSSNGESFLKLFFKSHVFHVLYWYKFLLCILNSLTYLKQQLK